MRSPRGPRSGLRQRLLSEEHLVETIDRLRSEGRLGAEAAAALRLTLPQTVGESAYVLCHLGAHLAIGSVLAFDVTPLPLGTSALGDRQPRL